MPFKRRPRIELENQSDEPHRQFFYVDYETADVDEEMKRMKKAWAKR